jgi:hypothetical protein
MTDQTAAVLLGVSLGIMVCGVVVRQPVVVLAALVLAVIAVLGLGVLPS